MSSPSETSPEASGREGWFKTTHWSVVLAAAPNNSAQASDALAKLCEAYWYPLYAYIRRLGHGPDDAKDLTQEFFSQLLAKDYLRTMTPEKGKFRSCLLIALKGFLGHERDRANRLKRGGSREIFSLEEEDAEARYATELMDHRTPDKVFDQNWALTLLEQVVQRLEGEWNTAGKAKVFAELKVFLTAEKGDRSYGEIARSLDMSEGTLRVNIHRLRQRYYELLRLEIGHTVTRPAEIEDEIRHLFTEFGG